MIRTRFAPSPTGLLHVGNVRTALVNWLFARKFSGEFWLRIDDTDLLRSKAEYVDAIFQDLSWLGMNWDRIEYQSKRLERYNLVRQQLIEMGRLYPCFESPEELELKRKLQLGQGKPPLYDRSALKLTKEQIEQNIAAGKRPHYRFLLDDSKMAWDDLVRGDVHFDERSMSDPILVREDGSWTYMLCSVVDDIDMGITHIIRGEDHISNTAVQLQMFAAIGGAIPQFAHLARIASKDAKISKRLGGFDIQTLREEKGLEAMTINNFLAAVGTSDPVMHYTEIHELLENFDISKWHKSPTNYDEQDLVKINGKVLAAISFEQIQSRLKAASLEQIDQHFWDVVKHNLNSFNDLFSWYEICFGSFVPTITDADFLCKVVDLLPQDEWNREVWSRWLENIKSATDRKGRDLFMPIRLALTGMEFGPELKDLVYLLGREKVRSRLLS